LIKDEFRTAFDAKVKLNQPLLDLPFCEKNGSVVILKTDEDKIILNFYFFLRTHSDIFSYLFLKPCVKVI
jgi:hypothetical protein